jgi:hypothetical protein
MPRAKGTTNYKVDMLILVVEELLPNGAQGWQEAAALYQHHSGELNLRDNDDMKWHWIEKWIQQRIHNKTSSSIMGVELGGGDEGLSLSDEEEEVFSSAAENSRTGTPTIFVDGVGGVGVAILNLEEVGVAQVPPLPPPTQQSTVGTFWHVPHYQQMHPQVLFSPDIVLHPLQLPALTGATQALQRMVLQQQPSCWFRSLWWLLISQLLHSLLSRLRRS